MTEGPIRRAIERLDREMEIVRAEQRAFERFRADVRPLPIVSGNPSTWENPHRATTTDICEIFRSTVMETPDYGSAYGESFDENIAKEFSPGLAADLMADGPLTGKVKRAVVDAAERSKRRRSDFLELLEVERRSLRRSQDNCTSIEEDLDSNEACSLDTDNLEELIDVYQILDELERRCERLVEERQRILSETRAERLALEDPFQLDRYLYGHLGFTHPVVRRVTELLERIQEKRLDEPVPEMRA